MPCASADPTLALPFRWAVESPARGAADRWCVLVSSGNVTSMIDATPESTMYRRLTARLVRDGTACVRFDLPLRTHDIEADLARRTQRLLAVLAATRQRTGDCELALVGTSLGAAAIVRALTTAAGGAGARVAAAVLVGCVVTEPVELLTTVRSLDLVYGAGDLLGVRDSGSGTRSVLAPHRYGREVASLFHGGPRLDVRVHVLPGLDHLLQPLPAVGRDSLGFAGDPASVLAGLVDGAASRSVTREKTA